MEATYALMVWMSVRCADGSTMSAQAICADGRKAERVELSVLRGTGNCDFSSVRECLSRADALIQVTVDDKVLVTSPVTPDVRDALIAIAPALQSSMDKSR